MKIHGLTAKLIGYFSAALIVFAIVMSVVFAHLFRDYSIDVNVRDLTARANAIATLASNDALAVGMVTGVGTQNDNDGGGESLDDDGAGHRRGGMGGRHRRRMEMSRGAMIERDEIAMRGAGQMMPNTNHGPGHGYCRRIFSSDDMGAGVEPSNGGKSPTSLGAYLKNLNELAGADVWLAMKDSRTIFYYGDRSGTDYGELPEDAEAILDSIYTGEERTSEDFSSLLSSPTVTVGVPIKSSSGEIKGAVLLHRPLLGVEQSERSGLKILAVSLAVAFMLTAILSVLLARRFIRPLRVMEGAASSLTAGDYDARTGIEQDDEIGSLARGIDTLAERLKTARGESERLTKMRQDFLASVSHELRTPLTVLRGSLDMLTAGMVKDEERRKGIFGQMTSNVDQLQRLVGDLFELARLQNADFKIEKSRENISDALHDAIRAANRLAAEKNVTIAHEEDMPALVADVDFGRLRQMFLIVLDNAVKFSPAGGEIDVSVCAGPDGKYGGSKKFTITIADKGMGISQDELPFIFDRFHKKRGEANKKGTGLGLPIAREIARRHDIEIKVQSKENEGTTFIFEGRAI